MTTSFFKTFLTLVIGFGWVFSVQGQFAGPNLLPPSTSLQQTLALTGQADIDADGLPDLLIAKPTKIPATNDYTSVLEWQRNNGTGGFDASQTLYPGGVYNLATADLDNNGMADVILQSSGPYWLPVLGGGSVGAPIPILFPFSDWGDIDLDGDIDLVGYDVWTGVQWIPNDGSGNFSSANLIENVPCCVQTVRLGFFDNDLLPDVLTVNYLGEMRWYQNLGGGLFGPSTLIDQLGSQAFGRQVFSADMDNNGTVDILAYKGDQVGDQLIWWSNNGSGVFSLQAPVFTATAGDFIAPFHTTVGNFTSDIFPDILARTETAGQPQITLWVNNGAGLFSRFDVPVVASNYNSNPVTIDMDQDGLQDVLLPIDNTIFLLRNADNGNFDPAVRLVTVLNNVSKSTISDLNGDLLPDVLFSRFGGDGLTAWYPHASGGQVGAVQQITPDFEKNAIYWDKDIDGDGDIDLVQQSYGDDAMRRNNDGVGNFSTPVNLLVSGYEITDMQKLDGDNDVDMVAVETSSQLIGWLSNDGAGNFSGFQPFALQHNEGPNFLFSDLDLDGDLDLLATDVDYNLYTYFNDGAGQITIGQMVTQNCCYLPYFADLNADNYPDMIFGGQSIKWLANDGSGGFNATAQVIDADTKGAMRVLAADFDHDGDNDLVTASRVDSFLYAPGFFAWYENQGGGVFAAPQYFGTWAECDGLFSVDFDGDGDLDVFWYSVASFGWWENTHPLATNSPNDTGLLTVQPNPTTGQAILHLDQAAGKDAVLKLTNPEGRVLRRWAVAPGVSEQQIDLEPLPAGLYFIALEQAARATVPVKLVKQ